MEKQWKNRKKHRNKTAEKLNKKSKYILGCTPLLVNKGKAEDLPKIEDIITNEDDVDLYESKYKEVEVEEL